MKRWTLYTLYCTVYKLKYWRDSVMRKIVFEHMMIDILRPPRVKRSCWFDRFALHRMLWWYASLSDCIWNVYAISYVQCSNCNCTNQQILYYELLLILIQYFPLINPGPLVNKLTCFRIRIRFCWNVRIVEHAAVCLTAASECTLHTAESK